LQAEVKRAVSSTQRGKKASGAEQRAILSKVQALEAANPTREPARSDMIYGRWCVLPSVQHARHPRAATRCRPWHCFHLTAVALDKQPGLGLTLS